MPIMGAAGMSGMARTSVAPVLVAGHASTDTMSAPSVWRPNRTQATDKVNALSAGGMDDMEIPAYLRKGGKKGGPEAALSQSAPIKSQPAGEEEFLFDEEEFEIPSFIRMQAD